MNHYLGYRKRLFEYEPLEFLGENNLFWHTRIRNLTTKQEYDYCFPKKNQVSLEVRSTGKNKIEVPIYRTRDIPDWINELRNKAIESGSYDPFEDEPTMIRLPKVKQLSLKKTLGLN